MTFHEKLRLVSRKLEITEKDLIDLSKTKLKIVSIALPENLAVREKLIDIYIKNFKHGQENTDKSEDVMEIEEISKNILELKEVNENNDRHFSTGIPDDFMDWEDAEGNFRGKMDDTFGQICKESVFKKFEEVPTIPARLISLMKVLNANETLPKQRISLFPELLSLIEDFGERTFAVKNSNVLLHWYNSKEDETEDTTIFETNFINKSTFCNLIFELFLTKSGNKREIINFGNYKKQKKLLQTIQTLLWKNSLVLNSDEFKISTNDSILLQFYINYYLSAMNKVINTFTLKLNDEQNDLKHRFLQPIESLQEINEKLENENNAIERGNGWLILGYLQIFLFYDLGSIDPVQKIALKSKYIRENISELEHLMRIENLQSNILGTSLSKEREISRINHLKISSNEAKSFENFQAVRPSLNFQNLREEVENFSSNIGSFESIFKQVKQLNEVAQQLHKKEWQESHKERLHEAVIWKKSLERFSGKLENNFLIGFPDLVSPMISAISNLHHGLSILIHELSNMQFENSNGDICYNLLRFPVTGLCQENYINLVKLCSSEKLVSILMKQSKSKSVQTNRFTMIKIALKELENLSLVVRNDIKSLWEELNKIFLKIRILWKEQEKKREEEMREKQSLFKTKFQTKEEEELDFRNMFPGYQQDFLELAEVFPGNLSELERIPENVFRMGRNNLETDEFNLKPNFIEPLIQRFEMIGSSIKTWSENLSSQLVCCLNVIISQKSSFDDRKNNYKVYDFYRDPNIPEIEECQPLFDRLCERINEFLKEWPDNPILNSIKLIIDRLFSFSIDSSLSRFLVGVELLLTKIKQWEENARSDVSLAEFIESFGAKILCWRKLEISRWKDSLEVLEDDLKTEASKWWFFLFNLIDQYIIENTENVEQSNETEKLKDSSKSDNISKEKIIESLERFLTESSLIEFETRLQLMYLFHQHISHFEETRKQKELLAIFWNIYFYYSQFLNDVQNKIKVLKEPIAKKLKDTIKITRWNDISYWSVKNTAEKTRRTLHKFVKEFQKCLQENVASTLTLKTKAEILETNSRKELEPVDFLVNLESRNLQKVEKLTHKARQFCENIIAKNDYPQIRKDIEIFIDESLEESKKLRNLEVDKTLTKAKQQSQLKSMLQQKKMALANYFKTLNHLGISYRIGILTWKNRKNEITNFMTVPLDLREIQRLTFIKSKNENMDKGLIEQWSGCNKYYYESLIKLNFLDSILNSGKSDLDIHNAERCRGFSVHLVLLAHRQKETIANFFEKFLPLKIQVSNLILMMEEINKKISNSSVIQKNISEIVESIKLLKMSNTSKVLQVLEFIKNIGISEISVFLEMIKKSSERLVELEKILEFTKSIDILDVSEIISILEIAKTGGILDISQLMEVLKIINENVTKDSDKNYVPMQKNLQVVINSFQELLEVLQISMKQIIIFLESCPMESLTEETLDLNEITIPVLKERNVLQNSIVSMKNSLHLITDMANELNSWTIISKRIEKLGQTFLFHQRHIDILQSNYQKINEVRKLLIDLRSEQSVESENLKEYQAKLDVLVTQILLVIQKKFKDKKLIKSLEKDIPDLRLKTVSHIFGDLLQIIYECDVKSANNCIRSLLQHLPLIEQYTLFLHFYLYEQVASFRLTCKFLYLQLNVFLDLATNGFCQPKDLNAPEDNQEGDTAEGGMGLAEGEGHKDISEKIETEDQLEEVKGPNEEEKDNEKKDMKEEEKGIEMSENFEGHAQELEREEEKNNEENDDIDKEMENEKEESGTGEKTGQEELSAKDTDENKNKDDNEEREYNDERKEEKKDIKEFQEPEVNEDQIDPYHGKNQPEIEPESFELPEDMNIDEEIKEDNPEDKEENPFDIDQMKESKIPEKEDEKDEEKENSEGNKQEDSDEEDDNEEEDLNVDNNKRKDEKVINSEEDEKDDIKEQDIEDKNETKEDKAAASFDTNSKEVDASQEVESKKDGSRDAVENQSNEEQMEINPTESSIDNKNDKGTGQSQTEQSEGHSGSKQEKISPISGEEKSSTPTRKQRKPGQSDENRSLFDDSNEPSMKKLKTDVMQQDLDSPEEKKKPENGDKSETYEHIKNKEKFDDYVFDAATEEQIKKQASNLEEDKKDQMDDELEDDDDIKMHEESSLSDQEKETRKEQPQKVLENKREKPTNVRGEKSDDVEQIEVGGEVEGKTVGTTRVLRGNESTIHTKLTETESHEIFVDDIAQKRSEIEDMLSQWSQGPSSVEATNAWSSISALTESAARELSEKLRLVLEPTLSSRLKGDYRTGKRINMRKVIPYIASEFRKDKIWLRRTKPSKRDYQIVLAIDDSSSMADNHSKELAFESLSLIGKAMTYLEVGQLAVINFGEHVNILHSFGENFTEESGARLIQEIKFEQKRTMIGQLLDFTVEMFTSQCSSSDNAKLVTILSDGRGIFSEGTEKVTAAVRRAKLLNIFLVFIIIDNPLNKDSILDIRMPIFEDGKLLGIRSYMDNFPFPFYIILRDLNTLPVVLSDALRQWFEIVGRIDT
ncbi:PREDICTED: midasin-like [Eufriesea mexicana]|uniref:midasin-like n=1 Tax=Eufriesea mexicana TaxID=516756 RepID=UPI00083C25A7|nr:PREDICTED: midasin-like [Eufriesea mexicana]